MSLGILNIARKGDSAENDIAHFILNGFDTGGPPPPPVVSTIAGCSLYLSVPKLLLEGAGSNDESNIFALPAKGQLISWQCIGTVSDVDLQGSEDGGVTWFVLDNMTSATLKTFYGFAPLVKIVVNSGTNVSTYLIVKGKKL